MNLSEARKIIYAELAKGLTSDLSDSDDSDCWLSRNSDEVEYCESDKVCMQEAARIVIAELKSKAQVKT